MNSDQRYWQAKKVTIIGAGINLFLGCIKVIGGMLFHSHALIADGVHSFADLSSDVMVLVASKYGSQDADEEHPYGHGRIETAATMLLSLFLILAGLGIAWDSVMEMMHKTVVTPGVLALPIAIISILANEGLFHYTRYVGNLIASKLILANAWHHRSDAASSVVVVIGLLGSLMGYAYLDAIAAIIVGAMICQIGFSYGWNSIKELVDTAVDEAQLNTISEIIMGINGIQRIHQLRSRMMAGNVLIDVHIQVSPQLTVSEGHYIAQHVHHSLIQRLDRVCDVTVHVDPEDDEVCCPSMHLPNRAQLETQYFNQWRALFPDLGQIKIDYLDGEIWLDIMVPGDTHSIESLKSRIGEDIKTDSNIRQVRLLSEIAVIGVKDQ